MESCFPTGNSSQDESPKQYLLEKFREGGNEFDLQYQTHITLVQKGFREKVNI